MSAIGETASPATDRKGLLAQQLDAMESAAPEPQEASQPAQAPAPQETNHERPRDEAGKFLSKDKSGVSPTLETGAAPTPAAASAAPGTPAETPLWERPPASWKKDFHEPWKNVDPKVREYIWQREEQSNAGVMPLKEKAKLADEINRVAEPYMNTIRGLGVDLPKAVQGLMYADNVLRTAPRDQAKAYLLQLAQTYGINLGEVSAENPQPVADPNIHAIYNELNNVRGEFKSFQQQQREAVEATQLAEINRFKLKAEFFDEALPTMQMLANAGASDNIEELYNKAIRLDENLFEKVQARTQAQTAAIQSAAADKAAKAAKAAAVSVKTSTPGAQTTTKAQDRRAMLAEQIDNIDARF